METIDLSPLRIVTELFRWIGITMNPMDALFLALFLVGLMFAGYIGFVIGRFNVKVEKMQTRMDMHADHFDVLDDTHSSAQRMAEKALETSAYNKGALDILLKVKNITFKEKDEAQ